MGIVVYCPLAELSVTTDSDQDVWELTAAATKKCRLMYAELWSAETAAESCELRLIRRTTAGSGGASATPVKADQGDGAITAALDTLHTTPGTGGDILAGSRWEQLGPWRFAPIPSAMPIIGLSGAIALNLNSALGSTRTWGGYVVWEEL